MPYKQKLAGLSLRRIALAMLLTTALTGCKTTPITGTNFVKLQPSQAQIDRAARTVVCDSFKPITFSGSKDTDLTIRQVRGHNAALGAYKCANR